MIFKIAPGQFLVEDTCNPLVRLLLLPGGLCPRLCAPLHARRLGVFAEAHGVLRCVSVSVPFLQPAFIPTYKTVSAAQSPGCKLYPEVIMNGGVPGASITFEPGLWLLSCLLCRILCLLRTMFLIST